MNDRSFNSDSSNLTHFIDPREHIKTIKSPLGSAKKKNRIDLEKD